MNFKGVRIMGWPFLYLVRQSYQSSNNWGTLYMIINSEKRMELSNTYELPWKTSKSGKSKKYKSRIKIGNYEMKANTCPKYGWYLRLLGTGHRTGILIHRAAPSMGTEGCILPVPFIGFPLEGKNEPKNITCYFSKITMITLEMWYHDLRNDKSGNPIITIAANISSSIIA
jgi:hypothetical protein